jgi:hypothetical protein
MFQMKVSNEKLEGFDVIPPGQYDVKLVSFNPKAAKSGTSINLNPCMVVVGHPEFAGRKVFDSLNAPWIWPDFVHAFGLPMETDGKESWIPGDWNGDPAKYKADDPATWTYKGPLVGRTAKIEVAVDNYQGKDSNKVGRYLCAVADCATKFPKIRHIQNLIK